MTIFEVINFEDDLKNPFNIYFIINEYMKLVGEDWLDQYHHIITFYDCKKWDSKNINDYPMMQWLIDKNYLTIDEFDEIITGGLYFTDNLFYGFITGSLEQLDCFPISHKGYVIISEYIADSEILRKWFINEFCSQAWINYWEESINKIDINQYNVDSISYDAWLQQENKDYSLMDEFKFLQNMSVDKAQHIFKQQTK